MGGDGGSIPKRADIVKTKGYGFKRNLGGMGYMPNAQVKLTNEENSTKLKMHERWTKCYLTNEPLNPPVVICNKGFLYNKEAVINKLLSKSKTAPHIKKLSDIFQVKVSYNHLNYFPLFLFVNLIFQSFNIQLMNCTIKFQNKFNNTLNCLICPVTNKNLDYYTNASYNKCCQNIIASSSYLKCSKIARIKENSIQNKHQKVCVNCNISSNPIHNEIKLFSDIIE
ncbi:uncharacterized protein ELE39_002108 [Cryptosporidium sp. chipmunk genotype I]|uniref:uncharacterized protein n=1 Tax=Cryptosporidium sp. chipmunk genotype I TaxID=1280935 RepID=UPI00351A584B|nr:hypothetical protein ELE39_002108 [Cryptosporidium sp. chipmunk genotype I]